MPSSSSKSPAFTPATIALAIVAVLLLAVSLYFFHGHHTKRGLLAIVLAVACAGGAVYMLVSKR